MVNKKAEGDKDRLQQAVIKAIKTTMVGAVASIEEKFGSLWGQDKKSGLTETEQKFLTLFMELRKEILDKGNTQIRNCKQILDGHNVDFVGFHLNLPVVRRDNIPSPSN